MTSRISTVFTQLAVVATLSLGIFGCVESNLSNPCTAAALLVPPSPQARIEFYARKLEENPRLYAIYPKLAAAYIDKTRATHDPAWLAKAEQALETSLQIQPNYDSYKVHAELAAFRHRFDDAVQWADRARQIWPTDTAVLALQVEAHLNRGQARAAQALLTPNPTQDFYQTVATARWHTARHELSNAVVAFTQAAALARAQGAEELAVWAYLQAADTSLDANKLAQAQRFLARAERISPHDAQVRLQWARFHEIGQDWHKALRIYASIADQYQHPSAHQGALRSAKQLGLEQRAQQHFSAALTHYQKSLQAAEIYQLGALAQLYCDADKNLTEARALALQNLRYVDNEDAHATLRCIEQKAQQPVQIARTSQRHRAL